MDLQGTIDQRPMAYSCSTQPSLEAFALRYSFNPVTLACVHHAAHSGTRNACDRNQHENIRAHVSFSSPCF